MVTLAQYLKKYSAIPNRFIDEFFGIQDTADSDDLFRIDLDIVAEWLGARKDHLKDTLIYTYHEGIDYIIVTQYQPKRGRPRELILLTVDCFKRLCMMSKTPMSEKVRSYYIQLEHLVDKYKTHTIAALNQRIGILENNQKPIYSPESGVIYIFQAPSTENDVAVGSGIKYKIGKANKLSGRMSSHNSSHADNLNPLFYFEVSDIDRVESCLKSVMKPYQYRKLKEVYKVNIDALKHAIFSCDNTIIHVQKLSRTKPQVGGSKNVLIMFQRYQY